MKNSLPLFLILLLLSCGEGVHRVSRPQIGTIINLTMIGRADQAGRAGEAAFAEIERIESLMSPYAAGSDIDRINRKAGAPAPVSRETFGLIKRAMAISVETSGAFDITFAGIAGLWKLRGDNFFPPGPATVRSLLPLVDYRKVVLDSDRVTVRLKEPGMRLGLGGIAKGYAIERALAVLNDHGIENAIVDAGGDLQVSGNRQGRPWRTGLRNPRGDGVIAAIDMEPGESVATSGDYERFAEYRGKRYHHIIDPRTGFPAESGLASVSVITRDPVMSDALATAIFIMGRDRGLAFAAEREGVKVILVDEKGAVHASRGLAKRLQVLDAGLSVRWY